MTNILRCSKLLFGAATLMSIGLLVLVHQITNHRTSLISTQKLWSFNMGYDHHEQLPFQTFSAKSSSQRANMQQLWGFNLGYEHHEQKPIYFGVLPTAAARQMQLWGWKSAHHTEPVVGGKPTLKKDSTQKLWGYNLGYQHHEQKPIAFGAIKPQPAIQTQLFSPSVDSMDSEAESLMNPAMGRGSDLHVLNEDGVWTKPEFKHLDDNFALHTLVGHKIAH